VPQVANTTVKFQRLVETAARKHGVSEEKISALAADAVAFIVEIYGGRKIYIPAQQHVRAQRNEAIVRQIRAGANPGSVARLYGLSNGDVLRIVSQVLRVLGQAARGED
jgi:Mor family transcriptional regulator